MKITPSLIYEEVQEVRRRLRKLEKWIYVGVTVILAKTGGDAITFVNALMR